MAWITCVLALALLTATAALAAPSKPLQLALPPQVLPQGALPHAALPSGALEAGERAPSTLERMARSGLYGGLTGALLGSGWSLLRRGTIDGRTVGVTTGAGLAGGAAFGLIEALRAQGADPRPLSRPPLPPSAASLNSGLPGKLVFLRKGFHF